MKDGILTRAMAAIEAAGLPLAGTLHPAREAEYLAEHAQAQAARLGSKARVG